VLLLATLLALVLPAGPAMAPVGPGEVRSSVEKDAPPVTVRRFLLDVDPVTNASFLAFVRREPRWQRGLVSRLFTDDSYLSAWQSPTALGDGVDAQAPVTFVSWFAARAYCASRGKRLPTMAEWELAARASTTQRDASKDSAFLAKLLDWYARPTPARLPPVGRGEKNAWGVRDLHGLVWEWVEDFGAAMVTSDARSQNDADLLRFCGGGAANAANAEDYASFMRWAFRGSLEARYATGALGFRCAKDAP
jgi:formylglycine-generating enzyme required for sulfatase activity